MRQNCPKYGKDHGGRPWLKGQNVCYRYGRAGHKIWDCLDKTQPPATRHQHQRRVFTLNAEEMTQPEDMKHGKGKVNSQSLATLCDLGATRSFDFSRLYS